MRRIEILINCGIFERPDDPLMKAAFTELMICIQDLTKKVATVGSRIGFKDDVVISNPKAKHQDVTDLIFFIRNAVCHIDSQTHKFSTPRVKNVKVSFNVILSKFRWEPYPGVVLDSEYEDDICFFYGSYKIYLKRHIIRAFYEARDILQPHLQQSI